MSQTCQNCTYFKEAEIQADTLQKQTVCTRMPPQAVGGVVAQGHGAGLIIQSVYPSVGEGSLACGEYQGQTNGTHRDLKTVKLPGEE